MRVPANDVWMLVAAVKEHATHRKERNDAEEGDQVHTKAVSANDAWMLVTAVCCSLKNTRRSIVRRVASQGEGE